MKKWIAIVLLAVMLLSLAACGQKKEEPAAVGGWTLNDSGELSAEAKAAFDKAMEGLMGVNYTPVALLGTQLVSGTNYSILAEATRSPITPSSRFMKTCRARRRSATLPRWISARSRRAARS